MRTRIIAIIILILFIGWPMYFYWFFYKKNISSLIFLTDAVEPFTVSLVGKLEYKSFPLLDEVFRYKSTCQSSCIFSPIPPLTYELRISTNGREDIVDTVPLTTGEQKKYQVVLSQVLSLTKIWAFSFAVPTQNIEWYIPVGISPSGKVIAVDDKRDGGEVWVINNGRFVMLFRSQKNLVNAYIESTRSFLIVPDVSSKQSIYALDQSVPGIVFPNSEKILLVTSRNGEWKVQTEKNLYEYRNGVWKTNQRFTDFIDITSRYRVAYISKLQSEKLSLQNFPTKSSLIVLLDREENTTTIMKSGFEIVGFFYQDWEPAILDTEWLIHRVEIVGSIAK
jgi:hypothetical protein